MWSARKSQVPAKRKRLLPSPQKAPLNLQRRLPRQNPKSPKHPGTLTKPRRRKGQGGLFIIRGQAWNEVKQTYEEIDFYRATRDLENPAFPNRRKQITGTGRSPKEAQDRLAKSIERFYRKQGLEEAGIMRARTIDGLKAARARGKVGGRKSVMTTAKISTAQQMYSEGKYVSEIAEVLGVSRPTIYRVLDSIRQ